MPEISFKEKVKNKAIDAVQEYKKIYVDYEYLICSDAFLIKDYYIIDAKPDNYQHLIGVNSLISAQKFYDKCCDATLQEDDFNFIKKGQDEKSVKGSVRKKISVLSNIMNLFNSDVIVQEKFVKNQVSCSIATADDKCTLGFIDVSKSRPKSLLKGNELDMTKAKNVSLLLRRHITKDKFDEIIIGDSTTLINYYDIIKNYIDINLIPNEICKTEANIPLDK